MFKNDRQMSISIVLQYNMYIIVNEAVQHFLVCFYSNTAKGEFRGAHNESWKVAAFWGQILKMFTKRSYLTPQ